MSVKHAAEKCPRAFVPGHVEKLCRRCLFNDFPLVYQNNAIGDFSREPHFVRDANHRHSFFCKANDGGWAMQTTLIAKYLATQAAA